MVTQELAEAFGFTSPVLCALGCMVMMLMDVHTCRRNRQEQRLRWYLALTYLVSALGWLGLVLYTVSPGGFVRYHTVFLLALMLDQVMFYRLVAVLTGTGKPQRFSRLHVLIPLVLAAVAAVSGLLVPADRQLAVVYGREGMTGDAWFGMVYVLTSVVFIVYNTLYPLLSLHNIRRYRRFIVDYSSDAQRTSLDWLFGIKMLILVCVPVPLAGILLNVESLTSSWFVWLGALPYSAFYIILCYNMLDGNYLIIQTEPADREVAAGKAAVIDRRYFERYLRDRKPYLDPKLRITDLAAGLNTNRSYLSAFINREYDMNFSRLINRYRLRELDRLRVSSGYSSKSNMELVMMVGFGNYRNYLRVKREEDKLAVLKVFE